MEAFTLGRLCRSIGVVTPPGFAAVTLTGVSTDTRSLEAGSVFFALSGENFDATAFVAKAFAAGARVAVVPEDGPQFAPGAIVLRVPGVRRALLDFAGSYRDELNYRVVAITGSAGKTTTKDLVHHMIRGRLKAVKAPKSFNNDVGVPLTLLSADRHTQVVVVEIGTNHPGEIAPLAAVAKPDVAVITCIGASHLEGLGSIEGVAREKLSMLSHVREGGAFVLNGDDLRLRGAASALGAVYGSDAVTLAGFGEGLRCRGRVRQDGDGWRMTTTQDGARGCDVELQTPGRPFALDTLLALTVARLLGVNGRTAAASLKTFSPPKGRLNLVRRAGVTLVDDTYNANPTSVCASLEAFASLAPPSARVAVLGEMKELGPGGSGHHRAVGRWVARVGVSALVTVGALARQIGVGASDAGLDPSRVIAVDDAADVSEAIETRLLQGNAVLFKASRACQLERAVEATRRRLAEISGALKRRAA